MDLFIYQLVRGGPLLPPVGETMPLRIEAFKIVFDAQIGLSQRYTEWAFLLVSAFSGLGVWLKRKGGLLRYITIVEIVPLLGGLSLLLFSIFLYSSYVDFVITTYKSSAISSTVTVPQYVLDQGVLLVGLQKTFFGKGVIYVVASLFSGFVAVGIRELIEEG